jgi:hypothetical protein
MRYFYERPEHRTAIFGEIYECDHPVYDKCTLFEINGKGLAVIQQRYRKRDKSTFWGEIDAWIADDLYLHPDFKEYFDERAGVRTDGVYPTVTVRQIMHALRMKPLKKEIWETCFDRRYI